MLSGIYRGWGSVLVIFILMAITAAGSAAQNMPSSGTDTSISCTGTLMDPGGSSFYYSNADSRFVIDPVGNEPVSLQFTAFSTEAGVDSLIIYDGVGTSGAIMGSYHGSSLPNGGLAITSTSGAITLRFVSNCCNNYSGFSLNWSTIATPLSAGFAVSTSTPDYNRPVQFTSSVPTAGQHHWDFGDGNTSTDINPVHRYTTSGQVQARLLVSNCLSADTVFNALSIQSPPVGLLSSDTLHLSVPCGGRDTNYFTLGNSGMGNLHYQFTLDQPFLNYLYSETFESNTLGDFINQDASVTQAQVTSGRPAQGRKFLRVASLKSGNINHGLKAQITPTIPERISYYVQNRPSTNDHGFVRFGSSAGFVYQELFYSYVKGGNMYLKYGSSTFSFSAVYGQWYKIELRNIDFNTHRYDIYVDGTMVVSQANFIDTYIPNVDLIFIHHKAGQAVVVVDDIHIIGAGQDEKVGLAPDSGAVPPSGMDSIAIYGDATGLLAGDYWLNVALASNDTALDGINIPLKLTVTGKPHIVLSKNCINFGQQYTGYPVSDSVKLVNTGCDTAYFTSIGSSNSDITTSEDSLVLAPGDTSWLFVSLNPSVTGSLTDTVFMSSADTLTYVCIGATVDRPGQVATDSSSYHLQRTGCPDTVHFSLKLYNQGTGNLNWATHPGPAVGFTDDFNGLSIDPEKYTSWKGVSHNNNCGNINGARSLTFRGNGPRYIITKPLNTYTGGTIAFSLTHGFCERNEYGEGLNVAYSKDSGNTWTRFDYLYPSYNPVMHYVRELPREAWGTHVQFRIMQNSFSSNLQDVWVVDDLVINTSLDNPVKFTPYAGTTSAGDSTMLQGHIYTGHLLSGSHSFPAFVYSNDPDDSLYYFAVNVQLNGTPELTVNQCHSLDTAMTGAVVVDSVRLVNTGCGDLVFSGFSTSTNQYSVTKTPDTIAPGDTAYVGVSFTGGATLGLNRDTLILLSNDTMARVCLSAYSTGAPKATVHPDSIYVHLQGCNDSATVALHLSNMGGTDGLKYTVGGSTNAVPIRLTVLSNNVPSNLYGHTMAAIHQMENLSLLETTASTAATLKPILDTTDVLLIPMKGTAASLTGIIGEIENYVQNGGRVMCLLITHNTKSVFSNLVPINTIYSLFDSITNAAPQHPVMKGLPPVFTFNGASTEVSLNGTGHQVLAYGANSTRAVVSLHPHGKGEVLYFAENFFKLDQPNAAILKNGIEYLAQRPLPDYITLSSDTGVVAANDSTIIHLKFSNRNMASGTYLSYVGIFTNDPLNPKIIVPVRMDANGGAGPELMPAHCVHLDSTYVGTTVHFDSVIVKNRDCDTMSIAGWSSSSGQFSLQGLASSIAPFDSSVASILYSPTSTGSVYDTLLVYSNFDTLMLCVHGKGMGVPLPQLSPDTVRISAKSCDGPVLQDITIENTGAGNMSYHLLLGQTYLDSSRAYFSVNSGTTQHHFYNLPVSGDTLWFKTVINGDFSTAAKSFSVTVDSTSLVLAYDNDKPTGTNDTSVFYYTGPLLAGWLADSSVEVTMTNTSAVQAGLSGSQDFHYIEISLERKPPWAAWHTPASGALVPADSAIHTIELFPGALAGGTYSTTLSVSSNSIVQPYIHIPVELQVIHQPKVMIRDTCLHFLPTLIGDTAHRDVWMYNTGCSNLSIAAITTTGTSFASATNTGLILPGDSLLIQVHFVPNTTGLFSASLIVANNDSTVSICLSGVGQAVPVASFSVNELDACVGQIQFNDSSLHNPTAYHWDFGDGQSSTLSSPTHTYSADGTYQVKLVVSSSAGSDSASQQVAIHHFKASFGQSHDTVKINTAVNLYDSTQTASSWNWSFGDGGISQLANPAHSYSTPGTYAIRLVARDVRSCQDSAYSSIYVYDDVHVKTYQIDGIALSLYPNPGSGSFYLQADGLYWPSYRIEIFDATGRLVKVVSPQNVDILNLNIEEGAGLYRIVISEDGAYKAGLSAIVR